MRAQGPQHSRFQAIAIENVQDKTERKRKSKESKFLTKENFRQSRPQKKEPEEREGLAMGELKCRSVKCCESTRAPTFKILKILSEICSYYFCYCYKHDIVCSPKS